MSDEQHTAPDASRRQFLQMAVPTLAVAAGSNLFAQPANQAPPKPAAKGAASILACV